MTFSKERSESAAREKNYVGEWRSKEMYLLILDDGSLLKNFLTWWQKVISFYL